jgi:hypothetical protein
MSSYGITPNFASVLLSPLSGGRPRVPIICVQLHDGLPGVGLSNQIAIERQELAITSPQNSGVILTGGPPSWDILGAYVIPAVSLWTGFEDDPSAGCMFTLAADQAVNVDVGDTLILNTCALQWQPAAEGLWNPDGTVEAPAMLARAQMFAPTVSGGATVSAPVMRAAAQMFAPTVVIGTDPPPPMLAQAQMFAPTISGGATVSAPVMRAAAQMFPPVISASAIVLPPAMQAAAQMFAPTVSGGATVSAPVMRAAAQMFPPTVSATNPTATWLATGAGVHGAIPFGFTDTVPAAANCSLIWACFKSSAAVATTDVSATLGSASADLECLVEVSASGGVYGYIAAFSVMVPPKNSQAVEFTCATAVSGVMTIEHFENVSAIGTPITAANQAGGLSMGVVTDVPQHLYVNAMSQYIPTVGATFTAYTQTERFLFAQTATTNMPFVIGDAAGTGSTVTFTASRLDSTGQVGWGGIILPLL